MWLILDNERYHINNCKENIGRVSIFQHCLTLAYHHLHRLFTYIQVFSKHDILNHTEAQF